MSDWLQIKSGFGGVSEIDFSTPLVVPKNHDVRAVAIAGAANIDVVAGIAGYLALVQ